MPLLLALDQGTTSSRAIAFDEAGEVVASAARPLATRYPRPGWVEQDAEELWAGQRDAAAEAVAALGDRAGEVAAVGITNQRETVVLWDRATGEPVAPAIVWQDRRTTDACERLVEEGHEEDTRERTGLRLDPYFSATKIAWLLDAEPGRRERAEAGELCAGTIDAWLIHKLTGGASHATDRTNASRTLLWNLNEERWDPELCERFGVPASLLPEVQSGEEDAGFGEIGSADRGLERLRGVAVRGVLGDQQAALLGQGCLGPGPVKCTYGTGCFLLAHTGAERQRSEHRLLETAAAGGGFALEGGVFVGGAVVQWLRDGLKLAETTEEIAQLADSVPDAGGVVLVPAFAGLGAPHWDPRARGSVQGLTAGTTAAHLCRAAVDAIAFQVADLVEAMDGDLVGGGGVTELRADGGAAANDTLMQFQADILQRPVLRPRRLEATASGAATAAGVHAGVWPSLEQATERCRPAEDRFEPRVGEAEAARRRERYAEAVSRCEGWAADDA